MTGPYAVAARAYLAAGWPCILPLPPGQKTPPPGGYTGGDGLDTDAGLVEHWVATAGTGNIALRLPDGVIGLDVDQYDKPKPDGTVVHKRGADHLAELEARLGPLPPTWVSSAREAPSGIRFYRVPPGRYRTTIGDAIEVIQRHHRYAIVNPSTNPEADGAEYAWSWDSDGTRQQMGDVALSGAPPVDSLPWLPEAWVAFLREGAAAASTPLGTWADGAAMRAALEGGWGEPCADLAQAAERALRKLRAAAEGSRHDALISAVHDVVHVGAKGHPGAAGALHEVAELWAELLGGDREHEYEAAVESSCRKAVTAVGRPDPVPQDPCLLTAGGVPHAGRSTAPESPNGSVTLHLPAPDGSLPAPPMALGRADVTPWTVRSVIGVGPFDPAGTLDQVLADAALERVYPGMRHAADAGRWLVRRADRWLQVEGRLALWALSLLGDLMPLGDPEAEKGTLAHTRHLRRARFLTSGPAGAIAQKIESRVVVGGEHPAAVWLTDLDADPDVLWAGGVPWDLRRSGVVPEPAQWIPPDTVHLHTAAVTPALVPTPRWDAFTAAVWPDPEIRAWAMRVLSIAVTGHSDRALPLLWGDTGRGKTQVVALIMSLLGTYAHAADPRLLTAADKAHASIVYDLKGRRLSFVDEGPRSGENPRERLKQLTGGGELTGNPMRGNPVTFRPSHTLVLTSNNEPDVADRALRERIRLIPCEGDPRVVAATRAALTDEAWQQEAPGVLAALMREAAAWLADRTSAELYHAPRSVLLRIAELSDEQDVVKGWLQDCCTPSDQGQRASELFQHFVDWCRRMGVRNAPNPTRWGRDLSALGFPNWHTREGKKRPLVLRGPGGWQPPAPPTPTGHTLAQNGGSPAETPSTPPVSNAALSGVTGNRSQQERDSAGSNELGSSYPQAVDKNGTYSNVSTPESVTGLGPRDRSVTGLEATSHEDVSAGEPPFSTVSVTGVTGLSLLPPPPPPPPPPLQERITSEKRVTPVTPVTEPRLTCENDCDGLGQEAKPNPSRGHAAAKPARRTRMTDEEKAERARLRKVAKAAERAEARRLKVLMLEGAVLALPAVVRRGAAPESIALADAGRLLAEVIDREDELTLDVEHTGYPIGHRDYAVRTVQLGDDRDVVVLDPHDPEQRELAALALRIPATLRAYNAVADLAPLDHLGVLDAEHAWERMHDPVIRAKLESPAGTANGDDLKGLSKARLGEHAVSPLAEEARREVFKAAGWKTDVEVDTPPEESGWASINHRASAMITYAASDVLDAAALSRVLPQPEPHLYERERRAQRVVSRVGHRGVLLDRDVVRELTDREEAAHAVAAGRLRAHGIENPNSDQQAAQWLSERGVPLPLTEKGRKPSVAKGPLKLLRPRYEDGGEIADFIDARLDSQKHGTALKLFLRPWRAVTEHGDGRARPTIYTLGADTGRMSCVRPNLQQVPREGGYRAAVLADPGWLLIGADFSSVEVRVMAALSGDPTLIQLVLDGDAWTRANTDPTARNPYDLHNVVAEMAFGPGWTKGDRYMVKRGVFGWAYGGGIATLAAQVGCTESTMAVIVDALATLAPRYVQWAEEVRTAVRAGAVEYPTYSGRVIKLDRRYPHKAPNYLIQGTARELLVDALIRWDDTEFGGGVVLPVHDEIVALAPAERAEEATVVLERCMVTELHGIPIGVGAAKPSAYWQDAA